MTSDLAPFVAPQLVPAESWGRRDLHGHYRKEIVRPLIGTVTEADRPLVLHLLNHEIEAAEAQAATSEGRRLFSYLLTRIGRAEDSLTVWRAKCSSFDGFGSVDIQFAAGAGVAETLAFLDAEGSEEAQDAAAYIRDCEATGDFDDLEGHLAAWDAAMWSDTAENGGEP